MKYSIVLFFFLFSMISFAQSKLLVIQKINSEFSKEIKENKRIKIQIKDGQKMYGRFTIIDSSSIMIDEKVVLLDDIVMMKKKSLFAVITNPIFITIGVFFIAGGIVGISAGGYGYIAGIVLLPSGTAITLISMLSNNHPLDKWKYSIKIE